MIRTSIFLLFLTCSKLLFGQECTEAPVDLVLNNGTVEEGLNQLAQQVPCTFSYNAEAIPLDSILTINLNKVSLEEGINKVLGTQVEIRKVGSILILRTKYPSKSKQNKKEKYIITGKILNRETGEVIKSVAILQVDNVRSGLTDEAGDYVITVVTDQNQVELAYRNHDYIDTIISIAPYDGMELNLTLTPRDPLVEMTVKAPTMDTGRVEDMSIVKLLVSEESRRNTQEFSDYVAKIPIQVSLLPTIGTNRLVGGIVENKVSINILAGYSHSTDGVEFAGLLNLVKRNVKGAQFAGFGNLVGGNLQGVQAAGFFNYNIGIAKGLQLAGFTNVSIDSLRGSQLSGFANLVNDHSGGGQFAGFINISKGQTKAVQFSGFINIAGGDMTGMQAAGFINVAKNVKGVQLAPFNIADSVSGVTLGLFSIVRKGYHEFELAYNSDCNYNFRFKSGTHHLYNIVQVGGDTESKKKAFSYVGYGLGTSQAIIKKRLFLDVDISGSALKHEQAAFDQTLLWAKADAGLSLRIVGPLHIFVQATGNYLIADQNDAYLASDIVGNADFFISGNSHINRWLGYQFGLRI